MRGRHSEQTKNTVGRHCYPSRYSRNKPKKEKERTKNNEYLIINETKTQLQPQTPNYYLKKKEKSTKLCDIWNPMRSNADSQTTPPQISGSIKISLKMEQF